MSKFYITTTLAYVNADPHIGYAAEIIKADCIARWRRSMGDEVFFNTGTDEHGQKIYNKALEAGKDPKEYCDEYAVRFNALKEALNLSYNSFIRTTDKHHISAVREFWKRCESNGDIYKKKYQVKYCVGCELEKTDSELVDGRCPLHPDRDLELLDEDNYFFRFSKYQEKLLQLYGGKLEDKKGEKISFNVLPAERFNEVKSFVGMGLEDFSISRLASKMPWGVPVPGDDEQVIYVWFDALVNYLSCLGWPEEISPEFKEYWPGLQVCGKDNLRQQTAMWQAMLMSAGLPNSKQVLVFGFITSNGQKMSKSLGNVVSPYDLVKKYGVDATRYYLLKEIKPFTDSDFSAEKFETLYNADLANGLGNLAARVSNLLEKNEIEVKIEKGSDEKLRTEFNSSMNLFTFDEALNVLWKKISACDVSLTEKKPWKLEDKEEIKKVLEPVAQDILNIAELLEPFMPGVSKKLVEQFSAPQIKKGEILFPRI